jgi:UDP-glucose 4-epimerase
MNFEKKNCLITGGLGFIGSNLALALVGRGAKVTLLDNMLADHGGNLFNIEPVRDQIELRMGDVRDPELMKSVVQGQDFIFHNAGQVSHILSLKDPFPDIDINIRGTAVLLEAVRCHAPKAVVVFSGTRGQYGTAPSNPVSENTPMNPKGIHELTKASAEKLCLIYGQHYGFPAVSLRFTNLYGPRAQMKHSHYGVVNWFVRLVLDGKTVPLFAQGKILRDFLYIDDAIEASLLAAVTPSAWGKAFNIASGIPLPFVDLVKTMIEAAGQGSYENQPFSEERKAQEPGDFWAKIDLAREYMNWAPKTPLLQGLKETFLFYRQHKSHYW